VTLDSVPPSTAASSGHEYTFPPSLIDTLVSRIADEVMEKLYKVRGLKSVSRTWDMSKREVHIRLNLEKIVRYGLTPKQVASYIMDAFSGERASILRVPGEDGYTIRPRFMRYQRDELKDLFSIQIKTPLGEVPLNEFAHFQIKRTRTLFTRQYLSPVVDVIGYRSTTAITHLQSQVNRLLKDIKLPPGYRIYQEGEIKHMKESFG